MNRFLTLFALLFFLGCNNGNKFQGPSGNSGEDKEKIFAPGTTEASNEVGSELVLSIVNFDINFDETNEQYVSSMSFDTRGTHVENVCQIQNAGTELVNSNCECEYTWSEFNQTTSLPIVRKVKTKILSMDSNTITCNGPSPSVYANEIGEQTEIRLKVIPKESNSVRFESETQVFFKKHSGEAPDFLDSNGRGFSNIFRYTCFEIAKKGELKSLLTSNQSNNGEFDGDLTANASKFCTSSDRNEGDSRDQCKADPNLLDSSQSYYYNLYTQQGDLRSSNNLKYICPGVAESLKGPVSPGEQDRLWPLDTSFALAQRYSVDYPVPVEAPSVLGVEGNSNTAPTKCSTGIPNENGLPSQASSADPNSISTQCIGFAKLPQPDGSCPVIKDPNLSDGDPKKYRRTYRLRRYIAQYPTSFKAGGKVLEQANATDTIYVLDREVSHSGNQTLSQPPRYTMAGPKPCNFAYYDHSGATEQSPKNIHGTRHSGRPAYIATNSELWSGRSIDGVAFPNQDIFDPDPFRKKMSCSAALPVINYDASGRAQNVSIATSHAQNRSSVNIGGGKSIPLGKVWIRPQMDPWAPHYVEDKDFQACAPKSVDNNDVPKIFDPPLHFAQNKWGNVAWCAAAYPTQNGLVNALDQAAGREDYQVGYLQLFTSPTKKRASQGGHCSASPPPTDNLPLSYPTVTSTHDFDLSTSASPISEQAGVARHSEKHLIYQNGGDRFYASQTCDRTIREDVPNDYYFFPLQADPEHIEKMLFDDPTYACQVTADQGEGLSGKFSPQSGCCANVQVRTDRTLMSKPNSTQDFQKTAHMQPDVSLGTACLAPSLE